RMGHLVGPVFGSGDAAYLSIRENNPIELIGSTNLCNGELQMFIAYGCQDEFNIDAQVESFLYLCKHRGLGVHVVCDPNGHHDALTPRRFRPSLISWLAERLANGCGDPCGCDGPGPLRPKMLP